MNGEDRPAQRGEAGVLRLSSVNGGVFRPHENKAVLGNGRDRLGANVTAGTILISRSNTLELVGAAALVEADCPDLYLPDLLWQAEIRDHQKTDPKWLSYVLASDEVRAEIKARASGTSGSMKKLSMASFRGIMIRRPPLAEQKAIAVVLSAWDRAIGQTAALIAAKERLKQGLMQQLLSGQRRLRGFRDPWQRLHLGDLFTERREPGQNGWPTLSVTLDSGIVRRESLDNPVRTSLEHEQHLLVRNGDIAYNMMRMWQGGSGMAMEDGVVSPAYVVCAPTQEIDSRFAHHLFRSPRMIYLFWAFSYGLTDDRRRLYYDEFARVPVSIPSLKEQRRIAALFDCLESEVALLQQRRESIARQKRGLMQQLLTGKVRVPKSLLKKGAKS